MLTNLMKTTQVNNNIINNYLSIVGFRIQVLFSASLQILKGHSLHSIEKEIKFDELTERSSGHSSHH